MTVVWVCFSAVQGGCRDPPSKIKMALVQTVKNKTNKQTNKTKNKNNYRPVSTLKYISKLLEKVALHQLRSQWFNNNLCDNFQSAYREHHSTETALLDVTNGLLGRADEGQVSILTSLDLSAAFDTLDHSCLLARLCDMFGMSGKVLEGFASYLSDQSRLPSYLSDQSRLPSYLSDQSRLPSYLSDQSRLPSYLSDQSLSLIHI